MTINKPSNGVKRIMGFFKATVSPKPRAVSSSLTTPARQILAFGGNLSAKLPSAAKCAAHALVSKFNLAAPTGAISHLLSANI